MTKPDPPVIHPLGPEPVKIVYGDGSTSEPMTRDDAFWKVEGVRHLMPPISVIGVLTLKTPAREIEE